METARWNETTTPGEMPISRCKCTWAAVVQLQDWGPWVVVEEESSIRALAVCRRAVRRAREAES